MSEKFTASNGRTLWLYEEGIVWEGGARHRIYTGAVSREQVHRCGRCANPFTGGNPDCPNNRPSQVIPYLEGEDE